jgi:hypothetical protein
MLYMLECEHVTAVILSFSCEWRGEERQMECRPGRNEHGDEAEL